MRAIILAAGMGTRLRPLTLETPKPLIVVNGESMLERQIRDLKEIGIEEIIVVTGYLKEKFDFLKEKYGVSLIHNDKYDVYNNIYTMYLVKDYLADSYVIEGDIYLNKNIFKNNMNTSSYFSARKTGFKDEWMLKFNENNRVYDIVVGSDDNEHIMCGVSYWNKEDGQFIANEINRVIKDGTFEELFWDDIVKNNLDTLNVKLEVLESNDIYEIDSLDDLESLKKVL